MPLSVLNSTIARARTYNHLWQARARVRRECEIARREAPEVRKKLAALDLSAPGSAPGAIANHEAPHDPPLFLPESALAHKVLDGLSGLEIGGAAHNAFGLNTKNVGISAEMEPTDFEVYKSHQIAFCGKWIPIDIPGYADAIPVPDSSQDFVIHSHVWEHLPNPLGALEEWVRVVRPNGYIYAIVPKRDAAEGDADREITPLRAQVIHYLLKSKSEERAALDHVPNRGHYTVFSGASLMDIELWYNLWPHESRLRRVAYQETDDKARNGHAIVWQVIKRA